MDAAVPTGAVAICSVAIRAISISVGCNIGRIRIGQSDGDFRHAHGSAVSTAIKDDIFHLFAAKGFRALLAKNPGDGVGDIALAAPVRADDRSNTGIVNRDLSLFRERFKPNHLDTSKFQHKCVFLKESVKLSV
jgi:hypothetical protein